MWEGLSIQSIALAKLMDLMGRHDYNPDKVKFILENTVAIDNECYKNINNTIEEIQKSLHILAYDHLNYNMNNMWTKNLLANLFALEVLCIRFEILLSMQYDEECEIECIEDGDFIDDSDER